MMETLRVMDRTALLLCLYCVMCAVATMGEKTGGAGSFAGGHVKVMTSHGAPVQVYQEVAKKDEDEQEDGFDDHEMDHLEELEGGGQHNEPTSRERRDLSRKKRFMSSSRWYVWPKGIVPYTFDMKAMGDEYRDEAVAAFTRWHKYTCIRFVPWVKGETMQKYGLTEESHIGITKETGHCRASQGNIHSSSGQLNSCCYRGTCTHELGHSLALYHEHQSPLRGDFIQLFRNRVPNGYQWTYKMIPRDDVEIYQYDISNRMHYPGWQFNVLYEDLYPLKGMDNVYYMYKDVSLFHRCHELHCNNATGECHNGGFVTLVDDRCSCLCPPGLDPDTDCGTTITRVANSPQWPADAFAMLSPVNGCPSPAVFTGGSWQHQGEGDNEVSSEFHLAGTFDALTFRYNFCVKQKTSPSPAAEVEWETGRYCIMRAGGTCPKGFQTGFIEYADKAGNAGQSEGSLPDGVFVDGTNTRLEFCCRDDGFLDTPLSRLPNTQPFILFESIGGKSCQEVAGMHWTQEYLWFDNVGAGSVGGYHPLVGSSLRKLWFCHYVPANYDCGGVITLTKSSPHAVITSPHHPQPYGTNMECNWLIKSEDKDGQVVVNFEEFKVATTGGCKDWLEIRYNLPGQPGLSYCGDGQSRTIRSIKDTVILTLRTDHHSADSDTGFNATASLYLPKEQGCYPADSRGSTYRGKMNYTRGMKTCLSWAETTECWNHGLHPRDFGAGLEENYCRNPDNTAMPWCYVTAGCRRDYCDVCNVENIYDKSESCSSEICAMNKEKIFLAGCAKTCNVQPPATPDKNAVCTIPDQPPSDASFAAGSKTSGTVPEGGTISFQCSTGPEKVSWTCLSDGQWSTGSYVCGACDDGWANYKGACYKYYSLDNTFAEASDVCSAHGAVVSSMKDREEMTFVSALRLNLRDMWIGARDNEVEGEFRWQDGSLVDWFNWDADNTPNNYNNQDCVEAYTEYYKIEWDDRDCDEQKPFVCKYQLSERKICVDRRSDCVSTLQTMPEMCAQQKALADQMCSYTCGLCQADATPQCAIPATSDDVILVSHQGQTSVSRGQTLQYKCKDGLALAQGELFLACGADGHYLASAPVCKDPETITQDSNDEWMTARDKTTSGGYAYTSFGSSLAITRNGVVKQWKFYSAHVGFTFFQVWRPVSGAGNFSMNLVGQSQVLSTGLGAQTYDVAEVDWIRVQPGDRIGIYENDDFRGRVPYFECTQDVNPEDFGVMYSEEKISYADFSPSKTYTFSSKIECMTFSFKAVIHPVDSVPATPKQVSTSQVGIVSRSNVGATENVYLGDSANFYVPADGYITEWQFFSKNQGTAAFQVWAKRTDLGERKYQHIAENVVNITSNDPRWYTITVPEGERIPVKAGEIIGVLYGQEKLGVPYSYCSHEAYPDSYNIHWYETLVPGAAVVGDVYGFDYTGGSYLCRVFSFRAIIEQRMHCVDRRDDCVSMLLSTPELCSQKPVYAEKLCTYSCGVCEPDSTPRCTIPPANADVILVSPQGQSSVARGQSVKYKCREGYEVTEGQLALACGNEGIFIGTFPVCKDPDTVTQDSNTVALVARSKTTSSGYGYTSFGASLAIRRHGVIKQWKYYSPSAGFTFFQVWRPQTQAGNFSFHLVGQSQVLTSGTGVETYDLAEADWIRVQPGDSIGIYEQGDFRGYVPYDYCESEDHPEDYGVIWAKPYVYHADFSPSVTFEFDAGMNCRTFSFKAVIHPVTSVPAKPDLATSQVGLDHRSTVGYEANVYLGDSANFYVPADGSITEWQFYANHGGTGAFQVWRKRADLGTRKYEFVGENGISLASDQKGLGNLTVPAGERIAVKAGDIIGFLYGDNQNKLGIAYNFCPGYGYPESDNIHWYETLTPGSAQVGNVYSFGVTGGSYTCRVFSFRAIVEQA